MAGLLRDLGYEVEEEVMTEQGYVLDAVVRTSDGVTVGVEVMNTTCDVD